MFRSKLMICLAALAASAPAGAGIRVLLGGGGYGEMQTLTAFTRIPLVIAVCSRLQSKCGLSEKHSVALLALERSHAMDTQGLTIDFPASPNKFVRETSPDHLLISSAVLYDNKGEALPFGKILETALAIFLSRANAAAALSSFGLTDTELADLIRRLAELANATSETLSLGDGKNSLHLLNFISLGSSAILFETPTVTRDLTRQFERQMSCARPSTVKIMRASGFYQDDGGVSGAIKWACDGRKYKSQVFVPYDDKHGGVNFANLRLFSTVDLPCETLLGPGL